MPTPTDEPDIAKFKSLHQLSRNPAILHLFEAVARHPIQSTEWDCKSNCSIQSLSKFGQRSSKGKTRLQGKIKVLGEDQASDVQGWI
jgi:hypothetical protein